MNIVLNCPFLDTGCTKKVCGQSRLHSSLNSFTLGDLLKVEKKMSNSFLFSDSTALSNKAVRCSD